MKIAKLTNENLVISIDQTMTLNGSNLCGQTWEALFQIGEVIIEEVDTLPRNFIERGWAYEGGVWSIANKDLVDSVDKCKGVDVRGKRDDLLKISDWTQVADAPVDQVAWAAYRQALRDVPGQPGFPFEIVWPEAPQA